MSDKDLIIINNEKISQELIFYCDNVDIKTISEDLNNNYNVTLVARSSNIKRKIKINLEKVFLSSNIFSFLYNVLKTLKKKQAIYLIISITPYTFLSYLFLFFSKKKVYVYLRSNGFEEYKKILGFIGPAIYYVMFKVLTFKSTVISCQERLFSKEKSKIVFPSELDSLWKENLNLPTLEKAKLLYVGRVKIEKGIFSLVKILDNFNIDFYLSIVGKQEKLKTNNKKINFIGYGYSAPEIIKIYDAHNISILPSFTEAHPKVLDESLSRMRPVIIFEEIKHVIKNKEGIFVSKRNSKSLMETINFIMKNYAKIQESMKRNKLPTKKEFILQMNNILSSN